MIDVRYIGRFGNNVFQYLIGRIIHEKLNYAITTSPPLYTDVMPHITGRHYFSPVEYLNGNLIDIDGICNNTNDRLIVLDGFFQRYEYFKPYKKQIYDWLKLPISPLESPTDADLVLHVRGGDLLDGNGRKEFNNTHPPAPFWYYAEIIENTAFDKLYIVTERKNDIVANKIAKQYDGIIVSQSLYEDFNFLYNAKEIVLSLSTFAWWAAWLSSAEIIHFPFLGMWHPDNNRNHLDLAVNEDRYIYHEIQPVEYWAGTDEQISHILSDVRIKI